MNKMDYDYSMFNRILHIAIFVFLSLFLLQQGGDSFDFYLVSELTCGDLVLYHVFLFASGDRGTKLL